MAADPGSDVHLTEKVAGREAFRDAAVATKFLSHYDTLRGEIRTEIVRRHLQSRLVTGTPLRVVDIGCGDARDSIWLATLGHDVLAVDPSQAMLDRAKALWSTQKDDIDRGCLTVHHGDERSVLDKYGTRSFDLVLSHGVLMYQPDPRAFLVAHVALMRDGAMLSLLTKNSLSLAYRAAHEGKLEEAMRLLDDSQSAGHLGQLTQAHSPQEISDWLFGIGATITSWVGVRIFADHFDETAVVTAEQRDSYFELEWRAAPLPSFRATAPLVHIIARRGVDLSRLPA